MKTPALLAALGLLLALRDANEPSGLIPARPSPGAALGRGPEIIRGQYIVVFRDEVKDPASLARKLAAKHRARLKHSYKAALKGMAVELPDTAVEALRREPDVAYIEPNQVIRLNATTVQTGATYGLDRIDQRTPPLSGAYR